MTPALNHADPTGLIARRDSIYATDLLITAIGHLDFFHWLSRNPSAAESICATLQLAARPVDVMLTLFAAMGLTRRDMYDMHSLTDLANNYLTPSAAANLGPYFSSLRQRPICADILAVLRTGKPFGWASAPDAAEWARKMEDASFADTFTAAMDGRGVILSGPLADAVDCSDHHRLLDIAGGSGIYAAAFIDKFPHLEAGVLEKPPVQHSSARLLAQRGYQDRIEVIAGDMFCDALPAGFDLHLYSHVIHDWDIPEIRQLLRASHTSLPPGGMIIIHDAHLTADKDGPLPVAEFSTFLMLCTRGRCYSVSEMSVLLEEAGFQDMKYQPTIAHRSVIIASKR